MAAHPGAVVGRGSIGASIGVPEGASKVDKTLSWQAEVVGTVSLGIEAPERGERYGDGNKTACFAWC